MKKLLGIVLVAILCGCLSACVGNGISGDNVVGLTGNDKSLV